MLSRLLLMILLFAAAWSTGVMYGAKAMTPHIATARTQGVVIGINKLAADCHKHMGFALERQDGKADIFLCIYAPEGYSLTPDGKKVEPQKPLHPKESQRF